MSKKNQIEQVPLSPDVAEALLQEAERRQISRAQVGREAIEQYLGFSGKGRQEPDRKWEAGRNHGRK